MDLNTILLLINTALAIVILYLLIKLVRSIKNPPQDEEGVTGYSKDLFIYEENKLITSKKGKFMAISMTDSQQASYTLAFVDKKGKTTDAASVELSIEPADQGTISYDDPTNTVTIVSNNPGVATIKTVPKDKNGNVLPFADEALEVTAGDAVSGSRSDVVITEQE